MNDINEKIGIIADIERASSHDGPGIRTVVFLKGCPLHCRWCHNPECINKDPEALFYKEKCIGCGGCAEGCFSGARVICGREITPEEVMNEIRLDKRYYGERGGITISGGEPLLQREFTKALAAAAKRENIGVAVETSLYLYDEELLRTFDLIMFDMKHAEEEAHREATGVSLAVIKKNIEKAAGLGIPMIARTPIVPEVNGKAEIISEISDYLKQFPSICKYELLPYHPLGLPKAAALGSEQERFSVPSQELMRVLSKYAFDRGVKI